MDALVWPLGDDGPHAQPLKLMATLEKWRFSSSIKIEGVGRSVPFEETCRRLQRVRPLIPITRITDLTSLDFLNLPVFSVTTPLARDLKVHLGKGETVDAARASAMMEAVERVSGEDAAGDGEIIASYAELGGRHDGIEVVSPEEFNLAPGTRYRADEPIHWVLGYDVIAERPAFVAKDLAVTPPSDGVLLHVNTNGLASGNTLLEATVHALSELVERDSLGQREFLAQYGAPADRQLPTMRIRPDTLPPVARTWMEKIAAHDIELFIDDISIDLGIPTYRCLMIDPSFRAGVAHGGSAFFLGFGTDLNATVAVRRAITETVQSRVGIIQGGRDSYNGTMANAPRMHATSEALWEMFRPHVSVSFADQLTFESHDILVDFQTILARLVKAGATRCILIDMTSPKLGIPVVRACVPGLVNYVTNKERVGWRCLRHLV